MRGDDPVGRVAKIGADLLDQVLAQAARTCRRPLDGRFRSSPRPRPVPATPQIAVAAAIVACRRRSRPQRPASARRHRRRPRRPRRRAAPEGQRRGRLAARPRRGWRRARRARGSPSSSSGFFSISASTNSPNSRFDSCSSFIACCSCGVITSDWVCRSSRRCERPILFTRGSVGSGAYRLNRSPR